MNWLKNVMQYKLTYLVLGIFIGLILFLLFSGGHDHASTQTTASTEGASKSTTWTCSMHPQIRQPDPGQCPICGMDLIPATSGEEEESGPRELKMSEAAMALAEIQAVPVRRNYVEHELRLVGKVEYDETRVKYITAWFPGRLDRMFVDYTGTAVRKGDHLVEIYSPSIITDQRSLIEAKRAANRSQESTVPEIQTNRMETLEKARERLRLLGLTQEQIQEIEERGEVVERITFYSPIDGIVIHKNALEGDYVQTGTRIYTIADLNTVWVKMDAYESDLQWIHYGQEVEFTTVSYPGEVFQGRVSFIDPYLNENTRTVKVRVNVENLDGKLKPEMFVRATVQSKVNAAGEIYDSELAGKWISPMHPEIIKDQPGTCDVCGMPLVKAEELGFVDPGEEESEPPLVIPDSAPLITGKRAVVYVKVPNTEKPTFQGREIVLGPRLKDHYIVSSGLEENEEVVVKGNFKIDSALQIQAKPSMMSPKDTVSAEEKNGGMPDMQAPSKSEMPVPNEAIPSLLKAYRSVYEALVRDDLESAQSASHEWVEAAKLNDLKKIEMLGHGVMHAKDLEAAREAFQKIADLMIQAVERHGASEETLHVIHCPMAFNNQGADWLQWQHEVRNPYFGDTMLTCGELKKSIEPRLATEAKEQKIRETTKVYPESYWTSFLEQYKALKDALVQDSLEQAQEAAKNLQQAARQANDAPVEEFAKNIVEAEEMHDARLAFSVISNILIDAVKANNPLDSTLYEVHCPMAFQNKGADWLQWSKEVKNPYYGDAMLTCGEVQNTISPSATPDE